MTDFEIIALQNSVRNEINYLELDQEKQAVWRESRKMIFGEGSMAEKLMERAREFLPKFEDREDSTAAAKAKNIQLVKDRQLATLRQRTLLLEQWARKLEK